MNGVVAIHAQLAGALAEMLTEYGIRLRNWLVTHKVRAVLLVLAVAGSVSFGQVFPTGDPLFPTGDFMGTPQVQSKTPSTYGFSRDKLIRDISQAVNGKITALGKNETIRKFGDLTTAFLLFAMLVWTGVKTMASGKGIGELIGEWVPLFVAFGIVYLFLNQDAAQKIVSSMDMIASAIGGESMATLEGALKASAEPLFKGITAVIDQPRITSEANSGGSGWQMLTASVASIGSLIMSVIAKLLTVFLLIIAAVVMFAHTIVAFVSVALAMALAPFMVPFLLFRPLEWLFNSWVRFLLGACMLKIVAVFLLLVAASLLSAMNEVATTVVKEAKLMEPGETFMVDVLLLGLMVVFSALAALIMSQAPSLANGLLAGSGGHGFSGLKGITQGVAGRSPGGMGQLAGGAAGAAAQKWTTRNAAQAGAAHAATGVSSRAGGYANPGAKAAYTRSYQERAGQAAASRKAQWGD